MEDYLCFECEKWYGCLYVPTPPFFHVEKRDKRLF